MPKNKQAIATIIIVASAFLTGTIFNNSFLTVAGDGKPSATTIVYVAGGELNVTIPTREPQINKDALELTLLDWTSRKWLYQNYPTEYGLYFYKEPLTFAFAFSPKQEFLNVTSLWVTVVASIEGYYVPSTVKFDIVLNDETSFSTNLHPYPDIVRLTVVSAGTEDATILKVISQGNNKLTLANPQSSSSEDRPLSIYKVTVFIEYEYQA